MKAAQLIGFVVLVLLNLSYEGSAQDENNEVAEYQGYQRKDIPRPGLRYPNYQGGLYTGPRIISGLEFLPGIYGGNGYRRKPLPLKPGNNYYFTTGQTTYIRWGKTSCPETKGTQLIYKGRAAGSHYGHQGGGSDRLCLPEDPEFLKSRNGGHRAYIYQSEYETNSGPSFQSLHNHDVPCATCLSTRRGTKLMIPGKITCLKGWTREYYGYLMAEKHDHRGRLQYACVDVNAEAVPGTGANNDGALFYHVEVQTGTLPRTYINGNEMTCVVCTK